jgi:hypothetical protein
VSVPGPGNFAGTVRWAIAPYTPRPPFRIYAGLDHKPYEIKDPEQVIDAARRGGDPEFTYLVTAKARPLLFLNNPARSEWQEVTALRLLRFSKIADPARQQRVRRHEDPLLFHLDPARFNLPEENAAIIPALVNVHIDAISPRDPVGILDANEMRVLGERVINFYEFDTRQLVERAIHELVERRRRRGT